MKRLILTCPTGLSLDMLTDIQQAAIQSVFTQYSLPMPGTKSFGNSSYTITKANPESTVDVPLPDDVLTFTGLSIIDAIVGDNFRETDIEMLGLPFVVISKWQWDGANALAELTPLSPEFINYLPDAVTYDVEGNVVSTTAPTLHIPHGWAGWPEVIL